MTSLWAALSFICIVLAYLHVLAWDRRQSVWHPLTYCPPPRVTWMLWFLVDLALLYEAATLLGRAQMSAYALGSFTMSIYAWRQNRRQGASPLNRDDYKILSLGILGVIAWSFSGGVFASLFLVAAASVGAGSLCRELRLNPKAYGTWGWILFWCGGLAVVLALPEEKQTFANLTVPVGFLTIQTYILWVACTKPFWRRGPIADASPLLMWWLAAPHEEAKEEEARFRRAA